MSGDEPKKYLVLYDNGYTKSIICCIKKYFERVSLNYDFNLRIRPALHKDLIRHYSSRLIFLIVIVG